MKTFLAATWATAALGASLKQVQYESKATSKAQMWVYVPDKVVEKPPIVVAIHSCESSASAYFQNAKIPWKQGSDKGGYITVWPSSPNKCWDASSTSTLTRDGGGDSTAISYMIKAAIKQFNADPERVYVTGGSSGGMMSNILAATYPDLIKAVSLYSGVPAGCFVGNGVAVWNNDCSGGRMIKTPEAWADVVHKAYPGYTGERPKMQFWHGSTDGTLAPQNYQETVKQWTAVFNVSQTPTKTRENVPEARYTTNDFGDHVQGIWAVGVGHSVPSHLEVSEAWFGLK